MISEFAIENGILKKYFGSDSVVTIPHKVTKIGQDAFFGCKTIVSVTIPSSVTEIGEGAFKGCDRLTSVTISARVKTIEESVFQGCTSLSDISIPGSVIEIRRKAFADCTSLVSVTNIDCVTRIASSAFENCTSLVSFSIPIGVTKIEQRTFRLCKRLTSITIPNSVTEIENEAFIGCENLSSINIPDSVNHIGSCAFMNCKSLTSFIIPKSITEIAGDILQGCTRLTYLSIPESVTKIGPFGFINCPVVTVVCSEGSYAHQYCENKNLHFIFDYHFEAYHGVVPPGIEILSSPFQADEEEPFVFISYSHKNRIRVLEIIKTLYEAGWRIWYDEGLSVGDKYDETLEEHVKKCSAFLLFVTEESVESSYIKDYEITWAKEYNKPVIKCILDYHVNYTIKNGNVVGTVSPAEIETKFEQIEGLSKGNKREAKGVLIAVDPAARDKAKDGFAYCLYSKQAKATAQTIISEVVNSGCNLFDAVKNGEDDSLLQKCATLIIFIDKGFLKDEHLTEILLTEYTADKDIVVCQLQNITDADLPESLTDIYKIQWLNFVYGLAPDMMDHLLLHLQKRGCRDSAVIPGFSYNKTENGIVITRYLGLKQNPRIEYEYGVNPVVAIAAGAFRNCFQLKSVVIPNSVKEIGDGAFEGCSKLVSIEIPDSVTRIGAEAFKNCTSLRDIVIPDSVIEIGENSFFNTAYFNDSTNWEDNALYIGHHFIRAKTGITGAFFVKTGTLTIVRSAFEHCSYSSITIPDGVKRIVDWICSGCLALDSITIPDSVTVIGKDAFSGRNYLTTDPVTLLGRFECRELTIFGCLGSYAEQYASKYGFPFEVNKD